MPYTVSYSDAEAMVTVRVWGDVPFAARGEAIALCREKGCRRILVDLRELDTRRSTTIECLDFGETLARETRAIRLAHVLPRDAGSRADVRFTSTVEANRGVVSREFDSIDEARHWLLSPPPGRPRQGT